MEKFIWFILRDLWRITIKIEEKIKIFFEGINVDYWLEELDSQKEEYVDEYTLEEHDGDYFEAYSETGSGEAESDIMSQLIKKYENEVDKASNSDVFLNLFTIYFNEKMGTNI